MRNGIARKPRRLQALLQQLFHTLVGQDDEGERQPVPAPIELPIPAPVPPAEPLPTAAEYEPALVMRADGTAEFEWLPVRRTPAAA